MMEFAIVRAGHDRGQIYMIAKSEDNYVYLVNGETKPCDKPKKKSKKHIQMIKNIPAEITLIMEEAVPGRSESEKGNKVPKRTY